MRCMATVTDRLYIFCLFLPFILVCAKEMRKQQQKSQQHSIVQNTDRQPPLFLSSIKKSPNACGEYAVFTTETSRFFSYTSIISQSISKNRRFFNCFLQNTKSISKIRTFFILVIINNGAVRNLRLLQPHYNWIIFTARLFSLHSWVLFYAECTNKDRPKRRMIKRGQ